MNVAHSQLSEFCRMIPRERFGAATIIEEISATPQECAAIARRAGLVSLSDFVVKLNLKPQKGRRFYRLEADFDANVVQSCVVTLEPVPNHLQEHIRQDFRLGDREADRPGEAKVSDLNIDPLSLEAPELIGPEGLDVGEIAVQNLILALEPYPRSPSADQGVELSNDKGQEKPTAKATPFSALEDLKQRMQ